MNGRRLLAVSRVALAGWALALAAPPPAVAQAEAETLKALLKGAASVEIREVAFPDEAKQRLATALGDRFDPAADGKAVLAVASGLPNPLDDTEKLEKAYALHAAAGSVKIAVVIYPDSYQENRLAFAAVRILAPAEPSAGLTRFAERFGWKTLGPNGWEPPAAFEALVKAAAAGGDEAAKQSQVLLDLTRDMQGMDYHLDRIKEGPDAAVAGAAEALLRKYETTHALYEQTGFVFKGSSSDPQKEIAILQAQNEKGIDEAKALKAAAAEDLAKARRKAGSLSCAKCHGIFMKSFQQLRAERKIGNGYFVPGHDLPAVDEPDAAAARDLAAAARKALLQVELSSKP